MSATQNQTVLNAYVDGVTILGDGQVTNPLRAVGGGGGGSAVAFSYVVTGAEPDPQNLTIILPAVRAAATYVVVVCQGDAAAQLAWNVPTVSRAVNGFVLALSAPSTAGDTFMFLVQDP